MPKKLTTLEFIEKARLKHSYTYDYSKVVYSKSHDKIIIICKTHGEFEQTPNSHLNGSTCGKCSNIKTQLSLSMTQEEFLEKSKAKHGNLYDYSKSTYVGNKNKVIIICKLHGEFQQYPNNHFNGRGCRKCGFASTHSLSTIHQNVFIEKCKAKHGNLYDYSKSLYSNSKKKVTIICKIHGEFTQTPSAHYSAGNGCLSCAKEVDCFSKNGFIRISKDKVCTFYIIRCFKDDESFYKIGITSKSTIERYAPKEKMPYQYEIIQEYKDTADIVWDMELEFKRKLKSFRYIPMLKFGGSKTECFTSYK